MNITGKHMDKIIEQKIQKARGIVLKNNDSTTLVPVTDTNHIIGIDEYTKYEVVGNSTVDNFFRSYQNANVITFWNIIDDSPVNISNSTELTSNSGSTRVVYCSRTGSFLLQVKDGDNWAYYKNWFDDARFGQKSGIDVIPYIGRLYLNSISGKIYAMNESEEFTETAYIISGITTPSGDPQHYMYESLGAHWNNTTGFWELNTLMDLTNEDMRKIAIAGPTRIIAYEFKGQNIRTNANPYNNMAIYAESSMERMLASNTIEVANIGTISTPSNARFIFYQAGNLRKVIGILNLETAGNSAANGNPFFQCYNLEDVRIKNLKTNINISDCSKLSNESIQYMIENAQTTNSITIILHPNAYDRAVSDSGIINALQAKPNIAIAK